MSTKKEILEQGIKEGTLTQEQLKGLTVAKIEDYADLHGIIYEKDVLKDDLIEAVLSNKKIIDGELPLDTKDLPTPEETNQGDLPGVPEDETHKQEAPVNRDPIKEEGSTMVSQDVVNRVGPTSFEMVRRGIATFSGDYQNWNLTRSQLKIDDLNKQIDFLVANLKNIKNEINK